MAKNKASKAVSKTASKSKAKAASASKSTKKATAQVVKKDVKPAKKEKNTVITKKPAKAVPAQTATKNTKPQPAKSATPVKGKAAPAPVVKEKAVPKASTANVGAKPAATGTKPAAPAKPEPAAKAKGPKGKEKPVLTPEQLALPKLPSNITYKRSKQKLAPGEKRLVKTEVITHHVIHDKPIEPEKAKKAEPKGKYEMEYIIRCPVTLLYDFLTTPSGLQEWFADDVLLKDDVYTFNWDGQLQKANLLNAKIDSYLRFRWVDKPEGTYVEFRITQDELTNEVSLTVTDFGDNEEDIATNKRLWDTQIQRLVKIMGAY